MGQYWQVINLDKRKTLGDWGKLGECLFDTSPLSLLLLLAIPIQPLKPNHHDTPTSGDWAGDRIICVGDYIEDYPQRVLTNDELEELDKKESYVGNSEWREEEGYDSDLELPEDDRDGLTKNLFQLASRTYGRTRMSHYDRPTFSNKHKWILRNLSKREYVRANAVAPGSSDPGDPCVPIERFGEVILSRISWSSDASAAMSDQVDITQGVWAGDRFDINIFESLEVVDGGAEWTDVSEEVAEEIFKIWKSEYGTDWRLDWRA